MYRNKKILVFPHHVDQTAIAKFQTDNQFAHVCLNLLELHRRVDLSAL